MKTLLKSATIIDPESPFHLQTLDILIEHGHLAQIAKRIDAENPCHTISLKNLHVSQGWLDSSVCFGEPGFEQRETISNGLKTAAQSGFTDILIQPNTDPVAATSAIIAFFKTKAAENAVNLHPVGALTHQGKGERLAELYDMKNTGAVAFGDYKSPLTNANLLKLALQYAQSFNGLICSFPEETTISGNGMVNEHHATTKLGLKSTPSLSEIIQITRDLAILEYTGGKLHIPTISTAAAVSIIKKAKQKGLDVTCSVAIHNLLFTDETLHEFDTHFKVLPPLRTEEDRKTLIDGIHEQVIDFVTTDHSPIAIEAKKTTFDMASYGTIGLESAFGALRTIFSTEHTIALLTGNKHRFNVVTTPIKKGRKASLSLFNPNITYTFNKEHILSSSGNSAFLGMTLRGKAYGIFNNNQLLLEKSSHSNE